MRSGRLMLKPVLYQNNKLLLEIISIKRNHLVVPNLGLSFLKHVQIAYSWNQKYAN